MSEQQLRRCGSCHQEKPHSDFTKDRRGAYGLSFLCRPCLAIKNKAMRASQYAWQKAWRQTPEGRATIAYANMVRRCRPGNIRSKDAAYASVEVLIGREDFLSWCVPRFARWASEFPTVAPSVDRIDPHGHYEIGNIQVIALVENIRRKECNKNVHAPDGTAWCSSCKTYLLRDCFSPAKSRPNGVNNTCKSCKNMKSRQKKLGLCAAR